ncbi:hypothetical protein V6N11_034725 [Hibiscus sabdariffa]|uniref:Fe2OG dioxygenase domain-containing protein n=1 Tax=Hibiscus sabdariffa TaxID=183260 RepID=A0ABR1ZC30_9ROSI
MSDALQLPIIDLSSPDRFSTANSIRAKNLLCIQFVTLSKCNEICFQTQEVFEQACVDHGFFYLVNHGVDEGLIKKVFEQSTNFFSLPIEDKMKLAKKNHREDLPSWRSTMETYHQKVLSAATKLLSLIALSLVLEEDFFEKVGALNEPLAFIRLLRYPGDLDSSSEEICGASAHSDYGTVTFLMTDGVPGLQICREKSAQPQVWEDVASISGAFIVNIGDMMERWTNCLFRSTLHRVLRPRQERYSVMIHPLLITFSRISCPSGILNESPQRLYCGMFGKLFQRVLSAKVSIQLIPTHQILRLLGRARETHIWLVVEVMHNSRLSCPKLVSAKEIANIELNSALASVLYLTEGLNYHAETKNNGTLSTYLSLQI